MDYKPVIRFIVEAFVWLRKVVFGGIVWLMSEYTHLFAGAVALVVVRYFLLNVYRDFKNKLYFFVIALLVIVLVLVLFYIVSGTPGVGGSTTTTTFRYVALD